MNIYKEIWGVLGVSRNGLAYITYKEDNKKFLDRKDTGLGWAANATKQSDGTWKREEGKEFEYDNTPTEGFEIVDVISRWSTSNKVIRVKDPRGFVAEIPTGNLVAICQQSSVSNGVINDKCVWAKDGNNNTLIPVSSDLYKESVEDTKKVNSRISIGSLKVGQMFWTADDDYCCYLGKSKVTWEIQIKKATKEKSNNVNWYGNKRLISDKTDEVVESHLEKETRWLPTFAFISSEDSWKEKVNLKDVVMAYRSSASKKVSPDMDIKSGNSVDLVRSQLTNIDRDVSTVREPDGYSYINYIYPSNPFYVNFEMKDVEWKD